MRCWLAFLTFVCFVPASCAQAGPWLREKGTAFTSFSVTATPDQDFGTSTYLEYGFSERMTLGADVATATSRTGERTGSATLFLRRALGANKGASRLAYELGVGTAWVGDLMLPHVKTGITWGRGYTLRDKNGWMTVDANLTIGISHDQHIAKLDTTIGLNFTDRTAGMLQLYLSHQNDAFSATLAPSFVASLGKSDFRVQIGTEIPVKDPGNAALKLGIWREF